MNRRLQGRDYQRLYYYVAAIALAALLMGCSPGDRPVLVDDVTVPAAGDLASLMPPAPPGTAPLPGPIQGSLPQPSADDAISNWARSVGVPFTGTCVGTTPPGSLCASQTTDPTVYFLGPNTTELWHVVRLASLPDGFVVERVSLAGTSS